MRRIANQLITCMHSTTSVEIRNISAPISFAIRENEASFIAVTDRRSASPAADTDSPGTKAQCLGLATDLNAAFAGHFVSRDDLARYVCVVVGAYDFPSPFIFGAMPGFELHCEIPMMVHARFASVASGTAGATTVSTSPALNKVAEFIVNVAVAADGAKTIVPISVPFLSMLNVVVTVAVVAAVPRLPESPAGRVIGAANT